MLTAVTRGAAAAWQYMTMRYRGIADRVFGYIPSERVSLTLMSLAMAAVIVIQTFVTAPRIQGEVIFLSMYVAAILSLPILRTGAVGLLIALTCFGEMNSTLSVVDREWVLVVAMAILALFKSPRFVAWASLIIFAVALYDAFNAMNRYGDPTSRIYHFALGASCILIAAITVWNRRQQQMAVEARTKRMKMRHNVIAASMIHDAVSNNLSQIILMSGNAVRECEGELQQKFKEIHAAAQEALVEVHSVIGFLDGSTQDVATVPYMQMVEGLMKISDDHLHKLGFEGDSTIVGSYDGAPNRLPQDLSLDVMHEVYVNIERHVDPAMSSYHVLIKFNADAMTIIQSNSTEHSAQWTPPVHSGVGMELIERRVEDMGGVMRTNVDEEEQEWHLFCKIPLNAEVDE